MKLTKTPAEQHEFNLRRYTPTDHSPMDPLYAAAQFILDQETDRLNLAARVAELEAENIALRAATNRPRIAA